MALFTPIHSPVPDNSGSCFDFSLRSPPPSVHLKRILTNYPEGSHIFKEALQNADDASARKFSIICDERRHITTLTALDRFLGPAVILHNDSVFKPEDWESMQNMFESEKADDVASIGRFGMGSRSYFHMTDILVILSGPFLALIDPDRTLSDKGGERYNYVEVHKMLAASRDKADKERLHLLEAHLRTFKGIPDFDPTRPYMGTAFRLPLRAAKWARTSRFAPYEYTIPKVRDIIETFKREISDCLLFLNHVETLSIYDIAEGEDTPNLALEARVSMSEDVETDDGPPTFKPRSAHLSGVRTFLRSIHNAAELPEALAQKVPASTEESRLVRIDVDTNDSGDLTRKSSTWRIVEGLCCTPDLLEAVQSTKMAPLMAVAARIEPPPYKQTSTLSFSDEDETNSEEIWPRSSIQGRVFNHLPIAGIESGLPVHIHGNFCLTDNRRDLWLNYTDLEGCARVWARWNSSLWFNYLPSLYLKLLQRVNDEPSLYALWPNPGHVNAILKGFSPNFRALARETNLLFATNGARAQAKNCVCIKFSRVGIAAVREIAAISPQGVVPMMQMLCSMAHKSGCPAVALPTHVKEDLYSSTSSSKLQVMSFLALMHSIILPAWNIMSLKVLRRTPFYVQWMLALCRILSQSRLEEIQRFRHLCENLACVPIEIRVDKDRGETKIYAGFGDEDDTQEDKIEDSVVQKITLFDASDEEKEIGLICPGQCYDPGLRGFRVACRALPAGEFNSPACLKVLRQWGLKQTLSWTDMTQEVVFRLCNAAVP